MVARIYVDAVTDFTPPAKEAWRADAACRGKNWSEFFPDTKQEVAEAKEFCTHCKVRLQCLAFAMKQERPKSGDTKSHRYGVFGGLSAKDRHKLQELLDQSRKENKNDHQAG